MSQQPTVLATVRIDVSPSGVKFTLEGLDTDLAELIEQAGTFQVQPLEQETFDTSILTMKSTKVISFVDPPTK